MNSRNLTVTGRFLIVFGMVLAMAMTLLGYATSSVALADDGELAAAEAPSLGDGNQPVRTIMIYMDGGASEANTGVCSTIIKEYLHASFNRDNFRIIVMTGGSSKWHLEPQYLRDKDGNSGTLTEISSEYNQVWEVYGAQGEEEGYLRLLDGDGVSGDGAAARTSENELMYDKDTLTGRRLRKAPSWGTSASSTSLTLTAASMATSRLRLPCQTTRTISWVPRTSTPSPRWTTPHSSTT